MSTTSRRTMHLQISVIGALRNWSNARMKGVFSDDDGRVLSPSEAKRYLESELEKGRVLLPCCKASECPDFDYQGGGCPGHDEATNAESDEQNTNVEEPEMDTVAEQPTDVQDAPEEQAEAAAEVETETVVKAMVIRDIPLDDIAPNPFQPRRTFTQQVLDELAASIKEHTLLQPLLVREMPAEIDDPEHSYQLVAGERRLRALKQIRTEIGEPTMAPCVVRVGLTDVEMLEMALEENAKRASINPIEEAMGYHELERMGRTQEQIGKRFGMSAHVVSNRVRLLDLPPDVRNLIAEGQLSGSHGVVLLGLPNIATIQEFAQRASTGSWAVSALASEVEAFIAAEDAKNSPPLPIDETKTDAGITTSKKPTKEPFAVNDKVQWNSGGKRPKWFTGVVADVAATLIWVQPSGTKTAKQRKSFPKQDCPLKPWDGKSAPGASDSGKKDTSTPPAKPTPAVAPEPRKAPEGMTPTFAPTDEMFYAEDRGLSVADVFAITKRLIILAEARSINVEGYLTALETEE